MKEKQVKNQQLPLFTWNGTLEQKPNFFLTFFFLFFLSGVRSHPDDQIVKNNKVTGKAQPRSSRVLILEP